MKFNLKRFVDYSTVSFITVGIVTVLFYRSTIKQLSEAIQQLVSVNEDEC